MIRRASFTLALVLLASTAVGLAAAPASAQSSGERIDHYDVAIRIQKDGALVITERIGYQFEGSDHHGIFRTIPVRFHYDDKFDRVYPLKVLSVSATEGASAKYKVEKDGADLRIRIGDANRTVSGRHTYTITYSVEGALNGFSDHDELYWNAVGDEWSVPIDRVRATVTAPADVSRFTCYAGSSGSTEPCSRAHIQRGVVIFNQSGLSPYQALTVVVAIPPGAVPRPRPILVERWSFARAFSVTPLTVGVALGLFVLLFGWLGRRLWIQGRDRRFVGSPVDVAYGSPDGQEQAVPLFEHGATPVEYGPPDEIKPGQMGTLLDEQANPVDVTATIIDFAVRGYLKIQELPKKWVFGKPDWRLVKLKEGDDLVPYERRLFDGLFSAGSDVDADDERLQALGAGARPDQEAVTLSSLRTKFVTELKSVQSALYDDAVRRGWFDKRPDRVRATWSGRGWLLFILGGGLIFALAAKTHLGLIPIPIALAGLLVIATAHAMPRRTAKGTGLVRRIQGFRTYIATAEKEEARFAERANLFSQYLPYAIVFGLTEKWARAFAPLGEEPPVSGWYVGPHPFTVSGFASSIDHFTVATSGTIASTPSGSGGSGFGGGGGAGGGGGGGGGGSW
jgi:Predicted membrane protein (DUF2207)